MENKNLLRMIMKYCVRNSGLEFGEPSFIVNILPLENKFLIVTHKEKKALHWKKKKLSLMHTDHLKSLIS